MKEKKIIYCEGGLGDHLRMSTLPEEWTKQGYEVYTSHTNYHRNLEIYDLVWNKNPYIKGHIPKEEQSFNEEYRLTKVDINDIKPSSFIQFTEEQRGIFNTGNTIPKLYINYEIIPELTDKTIVNLEFISATYEQDDVTEKLSKLLDSLNVDRDKILALRSVQDVNIFKDSFFRKRELSTIKTDFPILDVTDIYHHCNIIASCKNYICLHSGGASLAAAIKENSYVIMNDSLLTAYNCNNFIYPTQTYLF